MESLTSSLFTEQERYQLKEWSSIWGHLHDMEPVYLYLFDSPTILPKMIFSQGNPFPKQAFSSLQKYEKFMVACYLFSTNDGWSPFLCEALRSMSSPAGTSLRTQDCCLPHGAEPV